MSIGYNYKTHKVLGFIATEGAGSTDPGNPYLSCFPKKYSYVSNRPVVNTYVVDRYLNYFNTIYINNMMRQYDLAL